MIPVQNNHVDGLDDIPAETFKELYVRQIVEASNSVVGDMCNVLKISNPHNIQKCYLDKPSITKAMLIEWLETVSYILDSFCVPTVVGECCTDR